MASARPLLVITRPQAQALDLQYELEQRGFDCLLEPLLEIIAEPGPPPALDGVQALLVTSANAVPLLERLACELPVYAVGDATARAARAVHRGPVAAGTGTATALAAVVRERLRPEQGALLHLAGRDVRPELAADLGAAGFPLRRHIAYRAEAAQRLSPELGAHLRDGTVTGVLLFSPRTARILAGLVRAEDLGACVTGADAYCLSAAVAEAARGLPWRACRVAASPGTRALLALLDGPERRW